jgi:hypothetical protein
MSETIVTVTYGFNKRFGVSLEFENRNYFGGQSLLIRDGRDDVSKHRKVIQRFDPKTGQILSETSAEDLENNGVVLLMNYNLTPGTKIRLYLILLPVNRFCKKGD